MKMGEKPLDHRRQDDGEGQDRHRDRAEDHEQHALQPQQIDRARLRHGVAAVEQQTQRLHAAGGRPDREEDAEGQQIAAGVGDDIGYGRRQYLGHLRRDELEGEADELAGPLRLADEAGDGDDEDQEGEKGQNRHEGHIARDLHALMVDEIDDRLPDGGAGGTQRPPPGGEPSPRPLRLGGATRHAAATPFARASLPSSRVN